LRTWSGPEYLPRTGRLGAKPLILLCPDWCGKARGSQWGPPGREKKGKFLTGHHGDRSLDLAPPNRRQTSRATLPAASGRHFSPLYSRPSPPLSGPPRSHDHARAASKLSSAIPTHSGCPRPTGGGARRWYHSAWERGRGGRPSGASDVQLSQRE
jgi:hypothetical protein